jgi:hypothetical protein
VVPDPNAVGARLILAIALSGGQELTSPSPNAIECNHQEEQKRNQNGHGDEQRVF